jgi:hypothetical protein
MNKNLVAGLKARVDKFQCSINDLLRNIRRIWSIDQIKDEPVPSSGDEIFRVRFGCCLSGIA